MACLIIMSQSCGLCRTATNATFAPLHRLGQCGHWLCASCYSSVLVKPLGSFYSILRCPLDGIEAQVPDAVASACVTPKEGSKWVQAAPASARAIVNRSTGWINPELDDNSLKLRDQKASMQTLSSNHPLKFRLPLFLPVDLPIKASRQEPAFLRKSEVLETPNSNIEPVLARNTQIVASRNLTPSNSAVENQQKTRCAPLKIPLFLPEEQLPAKNNQNVLPQSVVNNGTTLVKNEQTKARNSTIRSRTPIERADHQRHRVESCQDLPEHSSSGLVRRQTFHATLINNLANHKQTRNDHGHVKNLPPIIEFEGPEELKQFARDISNVSLDISETEVQKLPNANIECQHMGTIFARQKCDVKFDQDVARTGYDKRQTDDFVNKPVWHEIRS